MPALEAVTKGDGTANNVDQAIDRLVTAGKTGTSSDQLSAQFVGFVPGMVTTVSMYQSDELGNSVPLDDVGGLDHFHGGDWPVDVVDQVHEARDEESVGRRLHLEGRVEPSGPELLAHPAPHQHDRAPAVFERA